MLPLLLSPERDPQLLRLTEQRVPSFSHDLVPDYLRTKVDPDVEQRMQQLENKAGNLSMEIAPVSIKMMGLYVLKQSTHIKRMYMSAETSCGIQQSHEPCLGNCQQS